ncbi:MAG: dephospho-CoA kinase [Saprospiraceae bacterium]|nr:dephospho-CoA kinase [Saprospiraceae bacterium]
MNPELPIFNFRLPTLKVGITGGIGSGKTTVCKIFETLGIPVYYADERAKWLMVNDPELIKGIKNLFSEGAYDIQGNLNRSYISSIVFTDPEKLNQLNALVHPAVAKDASAWNQAQTNVPYTLREAALIYEAGIDKQLDYIIVVTAPLETRIRRVIARDHSPRESVEARISKQMPEEEKVKRADFVIVNDGKQALIPQVLAIHQQLYNKAAN